MELTHQFTVPAPIDEAWSAFNDLERIAPCFPGASLTSYDGDAFEGLVKVKLGPISLQYTGTGRFVERDEAAHRAVIEAKGKDKRGNGTAAAGVTALLEADGYAATKVTVTTDLNITGKPAQFGRGVMQDVSDKLLAQFAGCLETKLGAADEPAADEGPADAQVAEDAAPTATAGDATSDEQGADAARHRAPEGTTAPRAAALPAAESPAAELDLGSTVLPVLARRYAPYVLGGLIVVWLVRKLLK